MIMDRYFGINESTIKTILFKSNKYQEMGKDASYTAPMQKNARNRYGLIIKMERLLSI